jgi:hypothetical protein
MRKIIRTTSFKLLALIAAAYLLLLHTSYSCVFLGGHWASNGSTCITRLCYYTGDCGNWVQVPDYKRPCESLQKGESVPDLYFDLGQPVARTGDHIFWITGKPDPLYTEAIVANERLVGLSCESLEKPEAFPKKE